MEEMWGHAGDVSLARPGSSSKPLARIQSHGLTTKEAGNIFWPRASERKGNRFSD